MASEVKAQVSFGGPISEAPPAGRVVMSAQPGPAPLDPTNEKDRERLAQRIARRPSKADLKLRNIIRVDSSESIASLQRQGAENSAPNAPAPASQAGAGGLSEEQKQSIQERSKALRSCLKKRPERQELMEKNILKDVDEPKIDFSLAQTAEQLKRAQLSDALESRLMARPNPDEIPSRVLKFDESVEVLPTFRKAEYNRRPDSNSTFRKLTPKLKMEIREELNNFKKNEMPVHADSLSNTAFH
ncbi:hypothetical protein BCR44DRAFT_43136, partial [Catenaria anguillulae PL171]